MTSTCPWATDAIDARIIALRENGVSLSAMCPVLLAQFHVRVTKYMLLRRTRTLGLATLPSVLARRVTRPVMPNGWETPERDAAFRADWDAGASQRQLATMYGVGKETIARRAKLLGFPSRDGVAPKSTWQPPPVTPRSPSGRQGSAFMFRGLMTPPKGTVEHVPGRCCWPLQCSAECQGRYCPDHAGLLKQRRAA